jgi:hypothetical protein
MSNSTPGFRLSDIWRRRSDDSLLSEPADVGTAFGLELSMLPDDESPAPPERNRAWWQRLTRWAGS